MESTFSALRVRNTLLNVCLLWRSGFMRGLASLLLAFLVSCGTPTAGDSGLLRVSARNSSVTLSNHAAQPVSYILATPSFLELADPVPCAQPGGCRTSVPANGTITVPYEKIWGY